MGLPVKHNDDKSATLKVEDKTYILNSLHELMSEENDAIATYNKFIDRIIPNADNSEISKILDRVTEIRNDELQHLGSLLQAIMSLDPNSSEKINEGRAGK